MTPEIKERIRGYLIDFVRILMLYLGIRMVLEYFSGSVPFDAFSLLKTQLPPAALLAALLALLRVFARPSAKK
jgi:hypothetical protein